MKFKILIFILIAIFSFTSCSKKDDVNSNDGTSTVVDSKTKVVSEKMGDDVPISRGQVAKILALTYFEADKIENEKATISFQDVEGKWYENYANAVANMGIMQGDKLNFNGDQPLTLQQAQFLLNAIDPNTDIKLKIDDNNKNIPISYALWVQLYQKALEGLSGAQGVTGKFNISSENIVVLATEGNNNQLSNYNIVTDKGHYVATGMDMDFYIDKEIKIFKKDKEIICVLDVVTETPTLENVYIVNSTLENITIFTGGVERTYLHKNEIENLKGNICTVKINQNNIDDLKYNKDSFKDKILKYDPKTLTSKENGKFNFDDNFKIYSIADGTVKWKSYKDIVVGTDKIRLFKDGENIIAGVIEENITAENIRVVLNTTGFNGLSHGSVELTSDKDFTVSTQKEEIKFKAGESLVINKDTNGDLFGSEFITVTPETGGRLTVNSIKRAWTDNSSPKYRGTLEISKYEGGYSIINELSLEEYLYAVVPSEMPSSYGVEAAKVQAVTARSYAYNQFFGDRFHAIGGNVDDSVSSQVYNNIEENLVSIEGVNSTEGLCLTYMDKVISANFFSTSGGMTANSGEVWAGATSSEFPAWTPEYLTAQKQYLKGDYGDLTVEENMKKFITDENIQAYEEDISWFRWNVEMTAEEISNSINKNIENRYKVVPGLIQTMQSDGSYASVPIKGVGLVTDMEILTRGQGGNIIDMKVVGTDATIKITAEYNVRHLIQPKQYINGGRDIVLYRKDGTKLSNYSIMPSSFYIIEKAVDSNGNITTVKFTGGGNGHGVGMSQNGANEMLKAGKTFDEVLKHYFKNTEIVKKI